jgi:hypothetical protein
MGRADRFQAVAQCVVVPETSTQLRTPGKKTGCAEAARLSDFKTGNRTARVAETEIIVIGILIWRRTPQGSFALEGSATFRPRRVRIAINGKLGEHIYRRKEAIEVIQNAIASGHAPANEYALVPVASEPRGK